MYDLKKKNKKKTNIKRRKPKAQLESRSLVYCVQTCGDRLLIEIDLIV